MAATQQLHQLQRLLSDYLVDESRVHEFTPFLLDAIIQNNLLTDHHDGTSEELAALKRKWTVRLNALLQSKIIATRWSALRLVKVTCEQSSMLYMAHVQSWSGQCLGFLARPEPTMVHTAAIEVLTLLFAKAVGKPEIQAEVSSKLMPRYNQLLLSLSTDRESHNTSQVLMPVTLPAFTTNMKLFPANTRHVMDKIHKTCIIPCLEGTIQVDPTVVGEYLSSSSKAGGKTSIPAAWHEIVLRIIGSIHTALDRLFDTVDEEDTLPSRPGGYEALSSFSADHVEIFPEILRRVRYLMDVLATCLTFKTEVAVVVPFGHIIQLLCRIFNVYEGCAMREFKPKNEYTCLMTLLPSLFISTNKLLASVIYCAHSGMIQLGKLLSRILLRLLTESKDKRLLRVSVYNLMALCLKHFGQAFASVICKPLVQTIVQDVGPQKRKNTVDIIAPSTVKGAKKRRLGSNAPSLLDGSYETIMQQPSDIQLSALDTAEQLLTQYGSSGIPEALRLSLDSAVVTRLLEQNSETDSAVKAKLYDCLLASVLNPSTSSQSTLLPHAIRIFSAGVNENTQELRSICSRGVAICDLCIHARLPPIQRVAVPVARAKDIMFLNPAEEEGYNNEEEDNTGDEMRDILQQEHQHTEVPPLSSANDAETPSKSTFTVEVPTVSSETPISIATAEHDLSVEPTNEDVRSPVSTSVVEVHQSSPHASAVIDKEVLVVESAMSDIEVEQDDGPVADEDTDTLVLKTSSVLKTAHVPMSVEKTESITTTLEETTIEEQEEEDEEFQMPDIDMAGPDDDE